MENFDNTQANSEGWDIFDCGEGATGGRWQIQRIDDPAAWDFLPFNHPQFASDEAAWSFVAAKADEGSLYHQEALARIKQGNPTEWHLIYVSVLNSAYVAELGDVGA